MNAIEHIKAKADIVIVIGEHVALSSIGQSYKGLCPFHEEKTPSFHVIPEKQFFHCFGCRVSGDVFSFVMRISNCDFRTAVTRVSERFGIEQAPTRDPYKQALYDLNRSACEHWRKELFQSNSALRYLEKRRINQETVEEFQLGFAQDSWRDLVNTLQDNLNQACSLGLIAYSKKIGGHYDVFRNRIMCPVASEDIHAFSGRRISSQDEPKYLHSKKSPINWYKGVFGWKQAVAHCRKTRRAVLVEGNFDVLALHQVGLKETISPLGTSLKDVQLDRLNGIVDTIVFFYDGDGAGRKALNDSLLLALDEGFNTQVWLPKNGQDPYDTVMNGQLKAVQKTALDGIEYIVESVWTQPDRNAGIQRTKDFLQRISDHTNRMLLQDAVCSALHINPTVFEAAVEETKKVKEATIQSRIDSIILETNPEKLKVKIADLLAIEEQRTDILCLKN